MYEKITYYSRMSQTHHVPVPAATGTTLKNGLIAFWEFENNLNDAVAAHTLVDGGGYSDVFTTGLVGQALEFDFVAAAENVNNASTDFSVVTGTNFSLQIWFRIFNLAASPAGICARVKSDNSAVQFSLSWQNYGMPGAQHMAFIYGAAGTQDYLECLPGGAGLSDGGWAQAVIMSDGSNLYSSVHPVGGSLLTNTMAISAGAPAAENGQILMFGNTNNANSIGAGCGGVPPGAYIDQVGFWNRALIAGEISQLYNGGAGRAYSAM